MVNINDNTKGTSKNKERGIKPKPQSLLYLKKKTNIY